MLTDEEILREWSGDTARPALGKNKVLSFARAVIAAHEAKRMPPEEWLSKARSLAVDYACATSDAILLQNSETPLSAKKKHDALIAHISTPPAGMTFVPEELLRIGELIRAQDNRATDQPLFAVRQKSIVGGVDSDYTDKFSWVRDGEVVIDDEEIERLEEHWKANHEALDGYERVGYVERYEFVTGCFTEQGCKNYLARDAHNLREPHIYTYGTYRNGEFQTVRDFLKGLPPPTQSPNSSMIAAAKDQK
jgi:hypothetical protein